MNLRNDTLEQMQMLLKIIMLISHFLDIHLYKIIENITFVGFENEPFFCYQIINQMMQSTTTTCISTFQLDDDELVHKTVISLLNVCAKQHMVLE